MKIGINTRFLLPHKMEGFGWFTYEVVKRLCTNHPEHEFFLFFDRQYDQKFVFADNVHAIVLAPQARHPILFKIWFDYSITKALKKHNIAVFLSPDGYLSLKTKVKQIAVIHDIYFEHYPEALKKRDYNYLHKYFPKFAKKASRIVTVSNFSKKDIVEKYSIDPRKIEVAYNGAGDDFCPITEDEKQKVKKKWTEGNPYFLFVGALQPRKNLVRLLDAFDKFKSETGADYKLLVVGGIYFMSKEMKLRLSQLQHQEAVVFCGHVDKPNLIHLMGAAEGLTFVSYFEGFGIPIIEAMKCACPVLVGNQSAPPEIAGDAALVCDPFDVHSIKTALTSLYEDGILKNELKQKGLQHAQTFSWESTAQKVWESIQAIS